MNAKGPAEKAVPSRQRRGAGMGAVMVTAFAWACPPLIISETSMAPLAFAAYRLWTGVAIYAVMFAVTGRRLRWPTIKACAPGGLIFAADVGLAFTAFHFTSVADATIIGSLSTVTIVIGAAIWFGETLRRFSVILMAVSLIGVVFVALGSSGTPSFSLRGDLAALCSVFTWTAYWLYSKRARATVGALEFMATVMLVAAAAMTVVVPVTGGSLAWPDGQAWLALFTVALFAGAIGHSLLAWSHQHLQAWLASLILNCQPIVSVTLAWLLLGQGVTGLTVAGGAMVLAASATLVVGEGRRNPDEFDSEPTTPSA